MGRTVTPLLRPRRWGVFDFVSGLLAAALLWPLSAPLGAAEGGMKSFQLRDGSVISGRLLELKQGHFVVESPSLGQLRIPEDDVLAMTAAGTPVVQPPATPKAAPSSAIAVGGPYAGDIQAAQTQILSSPDLMADVQALAQDPQMQALVNDPAFINALMSGNLQAIQDNPRTHKLMSNPKVQQLIGKVLAAKKP
jgi:hypothetical protein